MHLPTDEPAAAPSPDPAAYRVFVIDDHPLFRLGLQQLIQSDPEFQVCGHAGAAAEALARIGEAAPDALVVDLSLPGANGLDFLKQLRAGFPDVPILVLSAHDESQFGLRALRAGAGGYLMKRQAVEELLPAMRKVLHGEVYVSRALGEQLIFKVAQGQGAGSSPVDLLSPRESQVLELVGKGRSTVQIAALLELSAKTVESHRLHIKEKLGLRNSPELVRFAMDWNTHSSELAESAA